MSPVPCSSRTSNTCRSWCSSPVAYICLAISAQNSGKSTSPEPSESTSPTSSAISCAFIFTPKAAKISCSSALSIFPLPSSSNMSKHSLNSATCCSVSLSTRVISPISSFSVGLRFMPGPCQDWSSDIRSEDLRFDLSIEPLVAVIDSLGPSVEPLRLPCSGSALSDDFLGSSRGTTVPPPILLLPSFENARYTEFEPNQPRIPETTFRIQRFN
mmetsp:Transcript_30256/g.66097  ORF Transcript_30256/g.66097 Transcript_30256/m.66097 type:complete len:214 (-) Transcript_30256:203-844(-)